MAVGFPCPVPGSGNPESKYLVSTDNRLKSLSARRIYASTIAIRPGISQYHHVTIPHPPLRDQTQEPDNKPLFGFNHAPPPAVNSIQMDLGAGRRMGPDGMQQILRLAHAEEVRRIWKGLSHEPRAAGIAAYSASAPASGASSSRATDRRSLRSNRSCRR